MKKSELDWNQYQEDVATFFRSIGAKAETNATVQGARGTHKIDVLVSLNLIGYSVIWICECKYWNSAVPKEKVLVLYEIIKDIGADRGLLFSESGFQSGAVKVSNHTNILLTSLADVRDVSKEDFYNSSLIKFLRRINEAKERNYVLWKDDRLNISPLSGSDFSQTLLIDGTLLYLSKNIQTALEKNFPISFFTLDGEVVICDNEAEVNKWIDEILQTIESKIDGNLASAESVLKAIQIARENFISSVRLLLDLGDQILNLEEGHEREEQRLKAVTAMKAVGDYADELKIIGRGSLKQSLSEIMLLLIDTTYLYLSEIDMDIEKWNSSKEIIERKAVGMAAISKL